MTTFAERRRLAEVAASLIEQVGMDLVLAHLPKTRVDAPKRGEAVMPCRCGAMMSADDMRWPPLLVEPLPGRAAQLPEVICRSCYAAAKATRDHEWVKGEQVCSCGWTPDREWPRDARLQHDAHVDEQMAAARNRGR